MNIQEIRAEISKLELGETTMTNCEKLAVLYTVAWGLESSSGSQVSYQPPISSKMEPVEIPMQEYSYEDAPPDTVIGLLERLSFDRYRNILAEHF